MEVRKLTENNHLNRIGTGKRGNSSTKAVPGPGQYNMNTTIGGGPKYSMSQKIGLNSDRTFSPGPANYSPNYKTLYRNTSYTMRKRPNTARTEITPGVGNYDLRTEKSLVAPTYK